MCTSHSSHALFTSMFLLLSASQSLALSETDFQMIGGRYGVSPYLLRAISLVETQGGEILGNYTVYEVADSTQQSYLRKIARHTGRPITEFKGSYAGAMGYMQIMPSTFYMYAQDGDGDGIKDPLNHADNLATAAYFVAHKLTKAKNIKTALRRYNNSTAYCNTVFALYETLKKEGMLALR